MSSGVPSARWPARIVPPYTINAGRLSRPIAIRQPGMFLSQPGIATMPSYHWACITVSIESAMMSREGSEKLIPSVPIEIPSLTPMVLNRIPTMPAAVTPSLTTAASSPRCMLQVFPSYHMLAIPTWALSRSAGWRPGRGAWPARRPASGAA